MRCSLAVLLSLAAILGQQALAEGRGPAWPVHVIDSGLSGGDGVRLLDVDDDGDLDLAVGWEKSGVSRSISTPAPSLPYAADGRRSTAAPRRTSKTPCRLTWTATAISMPLSRPRIPIALIWYERLDASGLNWTGHEIAFPPNMGKSKGVKIGDINLDGRLDFVLSCASARDPLSGLVWME